MLSEIPNLDSHAAELGPMEKKVKRGNLFTWENIGVEKEKVKGHEKEGQEMVKEIMRHASNVFGAVQGNSWATLHLTSISGAEPKPKNHAMRVKAVPVLRRTGGGSLLSLVDGEYLGEWTRHPGITLSASAQHFRTEWLLNGLL